MSLKEIYETLRNEEKKLFIETDLLEKMGGGNDEEKRKLQEKLRELKRLRSEIPPARRAFWQQLRTMSAASVAAEGRPPPLPPVRDGDRPQGARYPKRTRKSIEYLGERTELVLSGDEDSDDSSVVSDDYISAEILNRPMARRARKIFRRLRDKLKIQLRSQRAALRKLNQVQNAALLNPAQHEDEAASSRQRNQNKIRTIGQRNLNGIMLRLDALTNSNDDNDDDDNDDDDDGATVALQQENPKLWFIFQDLFYEQLEKRDSDEMNDEIVALKKQGAAPRTLQDLRAEFRQDVVISKSNIDDIDGFLRDILEELIEMRKSGRIYSAGMARDLSESIGLALNMHPFIDLPRGSLFLAELIGFMRDVKDWWRLEGNELMRLEDEFYGYKGFTGERPADFDEPEVISVSKRKIRTLAEENLDQEAAALLGHSSLFRQHVISAIKHCLRRDVKPGIEKFAKRLKKDVPVHEYVEADVTALTHKSNGVFRTYWRLWQRHPLILDIESYQATFQGFLFFLLWFYAGTAKANAFAAQFGPEPDGAAALGLIATTVTDVHGNAIKALPYAIKKNESEQRKADNGRGASLDEGAFIDVSDVLSWLRLPSHAVEDILNPETAEAELALGAREAAKEEKIAALLARLDAKEEMELDETEAEETLRLAQEAQEDKQERQMIAQMEQEEIGGAIDSGEESDSDNSDDSDDSDDGMPDVTDVVAFESMSDADRK